MWGGVGCCDSSFYLLSLSIQVTNETERPRARHGLFIVNHGQLFLEDFFCSGLCLHIGIVWNRSLLYLQKLLTGY
jgi:hypothetical protein